jgi:hypothetical protein
MKKIIGFVILTGASALAVCAAQTPATSSAPAHASSAPQTNDFKPPFGYTREEKGGTVRYCHNEPVMGGGLAQRNKVCHTQAELEAMESGKPPSGPPGK